MRGGTERPVAIGLRIYRALANAFPHEFKNAYGNEMLAAGEDSIEPVWRRHGTTGVLRLLFDIAWRLPAEYLAEIGKDLRYAVRTLAGSPGFTAVALVSISLGMSIAVTSYSEMNDLILRNLPGVPAPDQLVAFHTPVPYPYYRRYRQMSDVLSSSMAYVAPVPLGISLGTDTERSWGHLVSSSYFSTLGVHPAVGRLLDGRDDEGGREPPMVVSYRFWQAQLGGDPSVVGRNVHVNGQPVVIVGVAPEQFLGPYPMLMGADMWLPLSVGERLAPELVGGALERRDLKMFRVAGRLAPGMTAAQAEVALNTVAGQLDEAYGQEDRTAKDMRVRLLDGAKLLPIRKQDLPFFAEFFLVVAGLVLLIACSNLANMMLARASDRRREISIRLALGASRSRLVRQLLAESLLIAACAGGLGFVLAIWLTHLLSQLRMPFPVPIHIEFSPGWRALGFTVGLAAMAGLAFGLLPALRATRTDLTPALKEGGTVLLGRQRKLSLRNLLLLAQVAGSLMLLLLVGLLSLGIQTTMGVQKGLNPANLYLVSLDPVRDGYSAAQAEDFLKKLLERVQRLPAVASACLTDTVPVAMNGRSQVNFATPGAAARDPQSIQPALKYVVGKDYFGTSGISILAGRAFRKEDEAGRSYAIIVTEELVRRYWKGEEALGRRVEIRNGEPTPAFGITPGTFDHRPQVTGSGRQVFEVVGVARDVSEDLVAGKLHPAIYFPLRTADYARPSIRGVTLMVRAVPGASVLNDVRREVESLDPKVTPFNAHSMPEQVEQFISPLRGAAWTYGILGLFGLILASVGLAGVTAYSVAQRGHEIGIRVALGATGRQVIGLVMREGAVVVLAGTVIGLSGAWVGLRGLSSVFTTLASTSTRNPVLVVGSPLLLASVALAACYIPARKSARIDPAVTLRQE